METQQIALLIVLAFAGGAGAGYTFPKRRESITEVFKEEKSSQRIVNQERFDEAKGVASLWGYELRLAECSKHSNYVRYNVYKDGVKIGWSNSNAETTQDLYYDIADNCKRYFPYLEERNNSLDKLIVDKKIESLKELKKEI